MADPQTAAPPLDEVMLAMDVVDTLRHQQVLVERELNEDQRDKQLIKRLREIYAAQGIEVTDHVLTEGLAALKEERFAYQPPKLRFGVRLARIYVSRDRWLKPLAVGLALLAAAVLAYVLLVSGPAKLRLASLPAAIDVQRQAIVAASRVPEAAQSAERLAAEGKEAVREGDAAEAERIVERLAALRADLEREYELRIFSRPNERSGVIRTPDLNPNATNYYIIVEPVAPDGSVLTLPVTSEEDGQTRPASAWGLRVEKDVYDRIAADKQDDGIIQNRRFGVKRRGYLAPEYLMPTSGRAITTW
jgi:hypothetical protein